MRFQNIFFFRVAGFGRGVGSKRARYVQSETRQRGAVPKESAGNGNMGLCAEGFFLPPSCSLSTSECSLRICQGKGECISVPLQISVHGVRCLCACGWAGEGCDVCPPAVGNCTNCQVAPVEGTVDGLQTPEPSSVGEEKTSDGGGGGRSTMIGIAVSAVGVVLLASLCLGIRLVLARRRRLEKADPSTQPQTWFVPRRKPRPTEGDTVRLRKDELKSSPNRCLCSTTQHGSVLSTIDIENWEMVVDHTSKWQWELGMHVVPYSLTGSASVCNGCLGRVAALQSGEHDGGYVTVQFPLRVYEAPVQVTKRQLQRARELPPVPGCVVRGPRNRVSIFRETELEIVPVRRESVASDDDSDYLSDDQEHSPTLSAAATKERAESNAGDVAQHRNRPDVA
eukprot:Hpha_TRINITY_DN17176_c0_g1::TRINITY_DN17176_c0_g1_i1::g.146756::m.146756